MSTLDAYENETNEVSDYDPIDKWRDEIFVQARLAWLRLLPPTKENLKKHGEYIGLLMDCHRERPYV